MFKLKLFPSNIIDQEIEDNVRIFLEDMNSMMTIITNGAYDMKL